MAGVWSQRQGLVQHALNYLSTQQLQQLLRQAHGIDKAIKGLRHTDTWNELIELTLNLSGQKSLTNANIRLSLQA